MWRKVSLSGALVISVIVALAGPVSASLPTFVWGSPHLTETLSGPNGATASPSLAVSDDNVFLVWSDVDPVNGDTDIYFKWNSQAGNSGAWWPTCLISPQYTGSSIEPDVTTTPMVGMPLVPPRVYVVWADNTYGVWHVIGAVADNPYSGGLCDPNAWTYVDVTPSSAVDNRLPKVDAYGPYAHIVWQAECTLGWEAWYTRWTGIPVPPLDYYWQLSLCNEVETRPDVAVAFSPVPGYPPSYVTNVVAVWQCMVDPPMGPTEIYASRNLEAGDPDGWPASHCSSPISGNPNVSSIDPSVDAFSKWVHVAWTESVRLGLDYLREVWYVRSYDMAATWQAPQQLTSGEDDITGNVATCGYCVSIVYRKLIHEGPPTYKVWTEVRVTESEDVGKTWPSVESVTPGSLFEYHPLLAADAIALTEADHGGYFNSYSSGRWHMTFARSAQVYFLQKPDKVGAPGDFPEMLRLRNAFGPAVWGSAAAFDGDDPLAFIYGGWTGIPAVTDCMVRAWDDATGWVGPRFPLVPPSCAEVAAAWDTVSSGGMPGNPATSIYVFGGREFTTISDKVLKHEPYATPERVIDLTAWNPNTVLIPARYGAAAVFDGNQYIYVFGGKTASGQHLAQVLRFDRGLMTFDPPAPQYCGDLLGRGISHMAAVWDPVGGRAILIGGETDTGVSTTVDVFLPNLADCRLSMMASIGWLPDSVEDMGPGQAPYYASSAVWDTVNNVVHVFGGQGGGSQYMTVMTFDPWEAPSEAKVDCLLFQSPRAYTSAVWYDSGKAIIFGGKAGIWITDDTVSWQPRLRF